MTKSAITIKNGLNVCFRLNSANLAANVGAACEHRWFSWILQSLHSFERSTNVWSIWNSLATRSFGTHPRTHWSDFSACSIRPFEINHCGVSGTKNNATEVTIGTVKQTKATLRQSINVFNEKMTNAPNDVPKFVYEIKMPRVAGSAISPRKVMIGASIRPTLRPSSELAMKICSTLFDWYIRNHAIASGMFTIIIARLRPK